MKSVEEKEQRELREDTHVQRFELIEKALIQIHGVMFVLCVCIFECYAHDYFTLFVVHFLLCYV
jgi:hypothetical protein